MAAALIEKTQALPPPVGGLAKWLFGRHEPCARSAQERGDDCWKWARKFASIFLRAGFRCTRACALGGVDWRRAETVSSRRKQCGNLLSLPLSLACRALEWPGAAISTNAPTLTPLSLKRRRLRSNLSTRASGANECIRPASKAKAQAEHRVAHAGFVLQGLDCAERTACWAMSARAWRVLPARPERAAHFAPPVRPRPGRIGQSSNASVSAFQHEQGKGAPRGGVILSLRASKRRDLRKTNFHSGERPWMSRIAKPHTPCPACLSHGVFLSL